MALNAAASAVSAEWHLVPLTQLGMVVLWCGSSFFVDFYVLRYPKDPEGTRLQECYYGSTVCHYMLHLVLMVIHLSFCLSFFGGSIVSPGSTVLYMDRQGRPS